jgi:hypothetical protein
LLRNVKEVFKFFVLRQKNSFFCGEAGALAAVLALEVTLALVPRVNCQFHKLPH